MQSKSSVPAQLWQGQGRAGWAAGASTELWIYTQHLCSFDMDLLLLWPLWSSEIPPAKLVKWGTLEQRGTTQPFPNYKAAHVARTLDERDGLEDRAGEDSWE